MIDLSRFSGISDEGAPEIADQIRIHRALGWKDLELRTVDGVNVCEMEDEPFEAVARAIEESEFSVVAFGSSIANWSRAATDDFNRDVEDLRRAAPRMRRLGTRYLRIMSYTDGGLTDDAWADVALSRVSELTRLAADEGIILVHENCDGWASQTPENLARLLGEIDDDALKIVFDPGNPLSHGHEPPVVWDFYRAARGRIAHFHVKDCYRDESGKVVHCFPGDGQCEVAAISADLESQGYQGMYSIEPHMTVQIHEGMDGDAAAMETTYSNFGRAATALLGRE